MEKTLDDYVETINDCHVHDTVWTYNVENENVMGNELNDRIDIDKEEEDAKMLLNK